jgi:uncharacterized protein YtpQ (UPF0354 family)
MSDEETPILDAEAFADELEGRLRAAGDVEVRQRDGMQLVVHVGANDVELSLDNFYRAYTGNPAALDTVADSLLRALRSYDAARAITSFEQLRGRVLPMLKPITLLAEVRERRLPMIAYRPFLADLIIAYVIDEPASVAYINERHLERWEIGEHDLHAQAIENLRGRTEERGNHTVVGQDAQRLVIFNTQDGFDATRLLLPAVLERFRREFPGRVVIGVPTRDFLLMFSDADDQILANIAHQIQLDAANSEHGLTDQLFTLENGQVREYEWE